MTSSKRFRINRPEVISETIDGETIVVDFVTGNYYSLDQTGATIWDLIGASTTVGEIVDTLLRHYSASRETIEGAVAGLISQLEQEQLILPVDCGGTEDGQKAVATAEISRAPSAFEAPVLHKYTDMQELLLLDPIHEVDDAGWPVVKPEPGV